MSRGDEAIAAAEVLVLRDELDSSRRKEAVTAKALGERSEVRRPVWRTPNFLPLNVRPCVLRACYGAGMRRMDDVAPTVGAGTRSPAGAPRRARGGTCCRFQGRAWTDSSYERGFISGHVRAAGQLERLVSETNGSNRRYAHTHAPHGLLCVREALRWQTSFSIPATEHSHAVITAIGRLLVSAGSSRIGRIVFFCLGHGCYG